MSFYDGCFSSNSGKKKKFGKTQTWQYGLCDVNLTYEQIWKMYSENYWSRAPRTPELPGK